MSIFNGKYTGDPMFAKELLEQVFWQLPAFLKLYLVVTTATINPVNFSKSLNLGLGGITLHTRWPLSFTLLVLGWGWTVHHYTMLQVWLVGWQVVLRQLPLIGAKDTILTTLNHSYTKLYTTAKYNIVWPSFWQDNTPDMIFAMGEDDELPPLDHGPVLRIRAVV